MVQRKKERGYAMGRQDLNAKRPRTKDDQRNGAEKEQRNQLCSNIQNIKNLLA